MKLVILSIQFYLFYLLARRERRGIFMALLIELYGRSGLKRRDSIVISASNNQFYFYTKVIFLCSLILK